MGCDLCGSGLWWLVVFWRWLVNDGVVVGEQWHGGWWVLIWFSWLGCGG